MIRVLRALLRFLESAWFATGLLVFVGVWSLVATLVAQGDPSVPSVAAWAAAHPVFEPVVNLLGLHHAFASLIFSVSVGLLAVSTALCAWRRTRVAIRRSGVLRAASAYDLTSLAEKSDIRVAYDAGLGEEEALTRAAEALEGLGVKTKREDGVLRSVSPFWSTWGSPIFHWALLALILVLPLGTLQRSEGLMGLAVGQSKPDAPASYGVFNAGPLHVSAGDGRVFRLDGFEVSYRTGGIDRGPTPRVTVLDGAGHVVATQRVYPNNPLQSGPVTIHPSDYGLSASLSFVDTSGVTTGRAVQLVDFDHAVNGGTQPVGFLVVSDNAGNPQLKIAVTVPLDSSGGQYDDQLPARPTARVAVADLAGTVLTDQAVKPGEKLTLPVGGSVRVDSIGYYARLSIVEDWTIPLLYAALAVALVGLTISVLVRQQFLVAGVISGPDGVTLAVSMRMWRNAPTSPAEIKEELTRVLGARDERSTS